MSARSACVPLGRTLQHLLPRRTPPVPCTVRCRACTHAPQRRRAVLQHLAGSSLLGAAALPSVQGIGSVAAAAAMATQASPSGTIVVYVTVPNEKVGEELAGKLVEAKLAACVNIVPGVTSVYWWDGKVNKDSELLCIIKTQESLLPELTSFVKANHPYDEPEVIGLPILGGSASYLQWLRDSTTKKA